MEAVIALCIFILVGALTARFGQDSRDSLHSTKRHLAAYGLTWGDSAATQPSPPHTLRPSHEGGD